MRSNPRVSRFKTHRISEKSALFNQLVPVLLIILLGVTLLLIVFAIAVLTGLVHWV